MIQPNLSVQTLAVDYENILVVPLKDFMTPRLIQYDGDSLINWEVDAKGQDNPFHVL